MASLSALTAVVTLLAVAVSLPPAANAQAQSCASKLVPCAQFLNATTTPPKSCCDPIKEAVATDLQCLCNLYANPAFLTGIGVNITQALRLPRLCGISSDTSACKTAQAPGGSTTKSPPGSSTTPSGGSTSSAGKIASSGIIGLFFISAFIMLF